MTTSGAVSSGLAGGVGAAGVDEALESGLVGYSALEDHQDLRMQRSVLAFGKPGQLAVQVSIQPQNKPDELSHGIRIRQYGLHFRHLLSASVSIALL